MNTKTEEIIRTIRERGLMTRSAPTDIAERVKEVQARGLLYRVAEVASVDRNSRTAELAFSSEYPVSRWFGVEVLSHDPAHVRLDRLNNGAPLLWNHDWDEQNGVVESARIDKDKRGRAKVRISRNDDGEELLNDIEDGIKRHVSVGYMVHGMQLQSTADGIDTYLVNDWEPYEISIVSVPADPTVGVGRSAEIPEEESRTAPKEDAQNSPTHKSEVRNNTTMKEKILRDANGNLVRAKVDDAGNIVEVMEVLERAGEAVAAGAESERARCRTISAMAAKYRGAVKNADELARKAIDENKSPDEFRGMLLDAVDKRTDAPLNEQSRGADIGMTDRETRQYSLMKVIRALSDPTNRRAQEDARFEFEASEAARDASGKEGERFIVPVDVLRRAFVTNPEQAQVLMRALNSSASGSGAGNSGGNLIATDLMAASFIDILRNRSTIMSLGRVMGGLVGNIDIPKQTAAAQGYWLGEDGDATETGPEFGQISLSPKTVAGFTEITRKLMMQSSLDVEAIVRADLAIALALTIDRAGYYGTGASNQPLGIINTSGINAVSFGAANPTYTELVEMETAIATDNADVASMAYVSTPGFRGYAKTTLKFTNVAGTIWEPGNTVNGYRTEITNQITAGDVVLGNFADFLIGMWGGLELTVDPYTHSRKGRIRIVAFQDVDFEMRRLESFCYGANGAGGI